MQTQHHISSLSSTKQNTVNATKKLQLHDSALYVNIKTYLDSFSYAIYSNLSNSPLHMKSVWMQLRHTTLIYQ